MNANAALTDRTISRAVTLERVKSGQTAEILRLLRRLERDLIRDLENANLTSFRKDRYEKLLKQTRETVRSHYKTIRDTHQEDLTTLAGLESNWTVRAINGAISEPIGVYIPIASVAWSEQQIAAIASNAVIDGAASASWWAKQATQTQQAFADVVKQGLLRGENTSTIVKTVRESVYPTSRRNAEALVRSSISAVSADARQATYKTNSDLINSLTWLSTLDGRTTLAWCIPRSQKRYTLDDHKPIGHDLPWKQGPGKIHWQCRSTTVANLKSWSELAGRPVPHAREEIIDERFREKLRAMGWDEERIAAARRHTQASMDGQVSRDLDFQSWLRSKPAEFQNEVLGKGKAELFRQGVITDVSQLVSGNGAPLTLKQLRQQRGVL